jgi:hypothetical protein
VAGGRDEVLAGGTEAGWVPGAGVVAAGGAGVTVAGPGAAGAGQVPVGAPDDGAPPHAARPAMAALAAASRASGMTLMPSACAVAAAPEWPGSPFPGVKGHPLRVRQVTNDPGTGPYGPGPGWRAPR